MAQGKVYLVGAGPGDVGLFTLKGAALLAQADVVVYDSLVGSGVLAMVPADVRRIYVGKRAGHHTLPQEEINQVLLAEAKKGYQVVRLKGGDPFLFGRGGEELELLEKEGIPYEVVPGVTSPLAVPAYNGIPVTHRDYCSSLHIITGHKKAGETYTIDFEALVRTKGTLVFLMGVTALGDICQGLLQGGIDPAMPAAILQQGTTARQKRIVATVSTLEEEVRRQGIVPPAIIVVGKVCALAEKFGWYEKLPLAGWRVLLTRPRELLSETAKKLRQKGAEVLEFPAICPTPLENQEKLHRALEEISTYQWLVFTSPTGVKVFLEEMKRIRQDLRSLWGVKLAAIGKGTLRELEKAGLFVDLVPEIYDGEHLGKALAAVCKKGDRVLIPRAKEGNQDLPRLLQEAGAQVADVSTYETLYTSGGIVDEMAEFAAGNIDCAVFTSASTVRGFIKGTPGLDYTKVRAACIGRQTKAAADAAGMETYMAKEATMDSLVELIMEMKGSNESWS